MLYYYIDNAGQQQGPVSIEQLAKCNITPATMVWNETMPQWQTTGSVPELAALFAHQAPVPPPTPFTAAPKSNKRTYIIAGIVAGVLAAGAVAAFFLLRDNKHNTADDGDEVETEAIAEAPEAITEEAEEAEVVEQGPQLVKLDATIQYAGEVPHRAAEAGNSYSARNMVDGNPASCWCVTRDQYMNEDYFMVDGPTLTFNVRCSKLDHVVIYNGYCKNSTSYSNNSRFSSITIFNAAESNWNVCEPIEIMVDRRLNDTYGAQTINIPASLKTNNNITEIGICLGDTYYGSKWPNDICLSEIEFWGYE